jgi:glycosyltransferase involved in cell wall biosynthesis
LRFEVFLKNKPGTNLPSETDFFKYKVVKPDFLWSQISLPLKLKLASIIDIFFSPAHYAPRFYNDKLVVTIHDLSYYYYPLDFLKRDLYKLMNWTKYSVKKAKKIIAVSESTKKDIVKFLDVPKNKIKVIYNGFEKKEANTKGQIKRLITSPYILYVGTLQPRKNLKTLIYAYSYFKKNNREFKLVIAGKKGWLYENILNEVKSLGLVNEILFMDFVNDEKLINLYKNAFCLVLPSFYEGFGIPPLEAMSYHCPVICSDTSSLPEVVGDAALLFDPKSKDELIKCFNSLKNSEDLRIKLIEKGKMRIKKFSWKKCAKETLDILINTANQ